MKALAGETPGPKGAGEINPEYVAALEEHFFAGIEYHISGEDCQLVRCTEKFRLCGMPPKYLDSNGEAHYPRRAN